ncbi:unnamed protein product [Kuraishia capsulata CBS 1993]|uniref:C2H2-type domain-containing protein n=1 Tax=Kuraishia capsulata CBS 1993 TaxID=1382522 RepID=W6MUB5_9ASCO|nr:uncharacterized protein KUCA_T00005079001 [Kuraishia capsulata CBS 1993]CDK29092.1 unnamed protein product [Kuraishia capsulata CBS 1993]
MYTPESQTMENMGQGNFNDLDPKLLVDLLSGGSTGRPPTFTTEQVSSILQSILAGSTPSPLATPNSSSGSPEKITDEDRKFLKLAEQVARTHNVDPTIRSVLERLQYFGSPHGGAPISPRAANKSSNLNSNYQLGSAKATKESDRVNGSRWNVQNAFTPSSQLQQQLQPQQDWSPHSFPDLISNVFDPNFRNSHSAQDDQFQRLLKKVAETAQKLDYAEQQKLYRKVEEILGSSLLSSTSDLLSSRNQHDFSEQPGLLEYSLATSNSSRVSSSPQHVQVTKAQRRSLVSTPSSSSSVGTPYLSPRMVHRQSYSGSTGLLGDNTAPTSPGMFTPPAVAQTPQDLNPVDHPTTASTSSTTSSGSNERSFVCETCSISFRRSSDLKRHEKTHLEVLPNTCPLCQKGFARKDALKRHIDTLTCKRNREKLLIGMNNHKTQEEDTNRNSDQGSKVYGDVVQNILSQFGYGNGKT